MELLVTIEELATFINTAFNNNTLIDIIGGNGFKYATKAQLIEGF